MRKSVATLTDFQGQWRLAREISDALGQGTSRFEGQASILPEGEGYRYQEEGQLIMTGQAPLTATQSYLWFHEEGGVAVCFADGRAFHRIDLTQNAPQAQHFCTPDTYQVSYDFSCWPDWSSHWRVTGPRKDYDMRTRFSRF